MNAGLIALGMTVYHTKEPRGPGVVTGIVKTFKGKRFRVQWADEFTVCTAGELRKHPDTRTAHEIRFQKTMSEKSRRPKTEDT